MRFRSELLNCQRSLQPVRTRLEPLTVSFVGFGFLALSRVILFEFFGIFLTSVSVVPETFLHLGIQVKINTASSEEMVMGLGLLGFGKES